MRERLLISCEAMKPVVLGAKHVVSSFFFCACKCGYIKSTTCAQECNSEQQIMKELFHISMVISEAVVCALIMSPIVYMHMTLSGNIEKTLCENR